jgi:hypothetical protein
MGSDESKQQTQQPQKQLKNYYDGLVHIHNNSPYRVYARVQTEVESTKWVVIEAEGGGGNLPLIGLPRKINLKDEYLDELLEGHKLLIAFETTLPFRRIFKLSRIGEGDDGRKKDIFITHECEITMN